MKKILIINKSDSTGGAAVVSRLTDGGFEGGGCRREDACRGETDGFPFVEVAAPPEKEMIPFPAERLKIFLANGLSRKTLFKIDTASDGLPLWEHPLVKGRSGFAQLGESGYAFAPRGEEDFGDGEACGVDDA